MTNRNPVNLILRTTEDTGFMTNRNPVNLILRTTEDAGFKNGDSLWKSPCRILVSSFEFEIHLRFKSFNSCIRSESSSESTLSGCVGDANFLGCLMLMVDLKGAELFLFFFSMHILYYHPWDVFYLFAAIWFTLTTCLWLYTDLSGLVLTTCLWLYTDLHQNRFMTGSCH